MKPCVFEDDRCTRCPQLVYRRNSFCFYHEKLKAGLVSRADLVLSSTELDTLFGGRRRNDGRRLDHYTSRK